MTCWRIQLAVWLTLWEQTFAQRSAGRQGLCHQSDPWHRSRFAIVGMMLLCAVGMSSAQAMPVNAPKLKQPTSVELFRLRQSLNEQIETTFGLVGVGKMTPPPAYAPSLRAYRAKWFRTQPEISAYLGLWVQEWETFPPYYSMAVFPSGVRGRMCVVEYHRNDNLDGSSPLPDGAPPPNPDPKFSIVTIDRGRGATVDLRLDRSLLIKRRASWGGQDIEFLGVIRANNRVQLYASQQVAVLDQTLAPEILQQFRANQCIEGGVSGK